MKDRFPPDFRFGVADADLQVVGEKKARAEEKSEESMWSWFARTSGKCHQDTGPELAIDRYSFWKSDVELMREMGIRNYRTSVSMARLLTPKGDINAKAAHWYETYFKALRAAGIANYVTLYHWEMPQFLNAQGGWKNRIMLEWMSRHAKAVVETLGEYIDEYFILNEPWCSSFLSYHRGFHAPGESDLRSGLLAAHNLLLAQGVAFETLKSIDSNLKISTVLSVMPTYAASPSDEDATAARFADTYFNRWFLDPIFFGKYPDEAREMFAAKMPSFGKADLALMQIGPRLNALGINYYRGELVEFDERAETRFASVPRAGEEKNDLGWPIYVPPVHPEGLYDILQQIWFTYRRAGLKKLYITENGMGLAPAKGDDDQRRIDYLEAHFLQASRAIGRGIPLKAFFVWTLIDNFEWTEGHRPESSFGMVQVDRKTMKRTKKASAKWFSDFIRSSAKHSAVKQENTAEESRPKAPVVPQSTPASPPRQEPTHILRRKAQPPPPPPAKPARPQPKKSKKPAKRR